MNRLFGVILAGFFVLATAWPAMGSFEMNHLIQVVYNENDNELGTDLGDLSTIDFSAQDVELRPAGSISLDRFPTISDWADLSVGYFAYNNVTYENWFATTQETACGIVNGGLVPLQGQASQIQLFAYACNEVAPGVAVVVAASLISYDNLMNDGSTAPGCYAGFNNIGWEDGESFLADLATVGYVDMYLYHYVLGTDPADPVLLDKGPDPSTDYTAVLRIMADGSTILNPSSGQNQPPVANDDAATTQEDTAVDINVVSNDTDPDGTIDPATVAIVRGPSNGTAVPVGDGTVTYTPRGCFTGTNTFTYTVQDNEGATSNAATVTVEVAAGGNQAPVANDDAATTQEDTAVDINVVSNDTDADGTIDATSVAIVGQPVNGSVLNNGDGTVTYTPQGGFTGTDNFTYTVQDNGGATSNAATVTVEVAAGGNQAPVANDDAATSMW
jgi:hypothetical protein